jgi:Domain of unknown function (DUF5666)
MRGQVFMEAGSSNRVSAWRAYLLVSWVVAGLLSLLSGFTLRAQTTAPRTPPALGTIKSISADSLTLQTDAGTEITIQLPTGVPVFSIPPGSKDLKQAIPIKLTDLQPGDRVLVRGKPGADGTSLVASAIIAMKAADIASNQQKQREEWQRHGIGGLVSAVDPAQNTVTIKTLTAAGAKDVVIHTTKSTILRRYAPGSINFDEAKVAPINNINVGDQLRARGMRSPDGAEFTADEIVSGSFRNIAGIVQSVDAGAGTLTVNDIGTKKPVELKVTGESKMRNVPEGMALGIAKRLKGMGEGANGAGAKASPPGQSSQAAPGDRGAAGSNGNGIAGGPPRGNGDVQQMLSRLPVSPLSDFKKGDVVMVVATSSQGNEPPTVITLLGGVEPILQATTQSQAASILSPWSLGSGGGGEEGTP